MIYQREVEESQGIGRKPEGSRRVPICVLKGERYSWLGMLDFIIQFSFLSCESLRKLQRSACWRT